MSDLPRTLPTRWAGPARSARPARFRIFSLALTAALAACDCGEEPPGKIPPTLRLVAPADGARLMQLDDARPDLPGIQVDVLLETSAPDGSQGSLTLAGAPVALDPATTRAAGSRIRILGVSLPQGHVALAARVVDKDSDLAAEVSASLTVVDKAIDCAFVGLPDGASLGVADDDATDAGFQLDVTLLCRGATPGSAVRITINGDVTADGAIGLDGSALVPRVPLVDGLENEIHYRVTDLVRAAEDQGQVRVHVNAGGCSVTLAPADGTFNVTGESGATADAFTEPGFQVVATIGTTCDDLARVDLFVDGSVAATGYIANGAATLRITVETPGVYQARAVVTESAGAVRQGSSAVRRWEIDPVMPALTIDFPLAGASFDDGDDAGSAEGFQLLVVGSAFGLDDGSTVAVQLDAPGGPTFLAQVFTDLGGAQKFAVLVDAPTGMHTVLAGAARPSGVTAISERVLFEVRYLGGLVALLAPSVVNAASDTATDVPGVQAFLTVLTTGLDGASGEVDCGGARAPFVAGATVPVALTFPDSACAGDPHRCLARVTRASDGRVFESTPVDFVVDSVRPRLTLTRPLQNARVPSATVNVEGTTTCASETQRLLLSINGDARTDVALPGNVVALANVALPAAQNRLDVTVSDAHGNSDRVSADVTVDTDPPAPVFETPAGNPTWTTLDDGSTAPGFQHPVVVRVDNEAAGTRVVLTAAGRAPVMLSTGADQKARALLWLPEGPVSFQACADDLLRPPVCVTATATVSTGRPLCTIAFPRDGVAIGPGADMNSDLADGVQFIARVDTATGPGTVGVELWLDKGTAGEIHTFADATAGVALIGPLSADEGPHTIDAACTTATAGGSALQNAFEVKLTTPALAFTRPIGGALLTLADPDAAPATPGFQTDVIVRGTNVSAGDTARLTLSCSDGVAGVGAATFDAAGDATFAGVTLATLGTCTLTSTATDGAGNQSPPASIAITIDRVPPILTLVLPRPNGPNGVYNSQDDAIRSTTGFEMSLIEAMASGVADLAQIQLFLDGRPMGLTPSVGPGRANFVEVALPQGPHTLRAEGRDASGNLGASPETAITVNSVGPSISWFKPTVSDRLNRAADTSTEPGFQGTFVFVTNGVPSGTVVRLCSDHLSATGAACVTGGLRELARASIENGSATLTQVSAGEGAHRFVGEVTDGAGNTSATPERVKVVDSVQPRVTAIAALEDTDQNGILTADEDADAVAGARVTYDVTVAGLEDNQLVVLRSTLPTQGASLGNALSSGGVARIVANVVEGSHQLWAEAADAQGNSVSTPGAPIAGDAPLVRVFTVATVRPSVTILAPADNAFLLAADDDSASAGMQATISVQATGGSGTAITVRTGGTSAGTGTLGGSAQLDVAAALPEGAQTLTATARDLAGNTGTSAAVQVTVDSIAPTVRLVSPPALLAIDADTDTPSFQAVFSVEYHLVEAGRTVTILSNRLGQTGTAPTTSTDGTASVTATLSSGLHLITARLSDVSGNVATSDAATVTVDAGTPSVTISDPVGNPVAFNKGDDENAQAGLQTTVRVDSDAPDGSTVVLLVGGVASAPRVLNLSTASFVLDLADGATTTLQARVTDLLGRLGYSGQITASADVTPPVLTRLAPTGAAALYVAGGNPAGIADKFAGAPLEADFRLRAQGAAGGTLLVVSDQDGIVHTNDLADADTTVTAVSVQLTSGKIHRLTFRLADNAGNTVEDTDLVADVDVVPPASLGPTVTVQERRTGSVLLSWNAPGDDGALGQLTSYQGRRADTPLANESAWDAATALTGLPAPLAPNDAQSVTLTGLVQEKVHSFGIRGVDDKGNLAGLGPDGSTADLRFLRELADSGTLAGTNLGWWLSSGDLDGDGLHDLVSGAPNVSSNTGAAAVWYGGSPTTGLVLGQLAGAAAGSAFGYRAAIVNDLNGDGRSDLVVSAISEASRGAVYIWFGSSTRIPGGQAPKRIAGINTNRIFGRSLAAGDLDGDGRADLLVAENEGPGRVFVFLGRANWDGVTDAAAADAVIVPGSDNTDFSSPTFGIAMTRLGRALGGDALEEMAVGSLNMNRVFVLRGHATAYRRGATATTVIDLSAQTGLRVRVREPDGHDSKSDFGSYQFGSDLGGGEDFDGDGLPDLAMGDPRQNRAYVYSGAMLQAQGDLAAPLGSSFISGSNNGGTARLVPDLDGDGRAELAFSHSCAVSNTPNALWVLLGRATLPGTPLAPDMTLARAPTEGDVRFGCSFAAGRFDADGHTDLAVGRPLAGSVQILY